MINIAKRVFHTSLAGMLTKISAQPHISLCVELLVKGNLWEYTLSLSLSGGEITHA